MRGPSGTDFEGGLYHFRIRLPAEYPFRPPSIMLLTPNGRFELNTKVGSPVVFSRFGPLTLGYLKICISFTNCERVELLSRYNLNNPSVRSRRIMAARLGRADRCVRRTFIESEALNRAIILLAIIALQGFFPLKGQAAMGIGALETPSSERKRLAAL